MPTNGRITSFGVSPEGGGLKRTRNKIGKMAKPVRTGNGSDWISSEQQN